MNVLGQHRKYDLEEEAVKLYHQDFKTVLLNFRRTPEYLKILDDKTNMFDLHVRDMLTHLNYYYFEELSAKVKKIMGVNEEGNKDSPGSEHTDEPTKSLRYGDEEETERKRRRFLRHFNGRRAEKQNVSIVDLLDNYPKLNSLLTLSQRNSMKDLGFEYAGHIIHALVKNLGSDDSDRGKSTKQTGGNDRADAVTTTEHVSVHEVTHHLATIREDEDKSRRRKAKHLYF